MMVYFNNNISTHNKNNKTNNAHKKTSNNLLFIKKNRAIYYLTSQSSLVQVENLGTLALCLPVFFHTKCYCKLQSAAAVTWSCIRCNYLLYSLRLTCKVLP